ncbi:major facilitator superfamily domain-containing protein [Lipomyces tetrasporus]|uniref:Major facilitator superfamily domain-containing protein n=1 Tax=Lipomyces tetrasporus TaxID=54092 RepID=A0AAD7QY73_9ASCO|nr:major facilitator superfamily domain-containing protein [Lipomyces tetrasporus]KAJ8103624.1 major facilitator superfamily domain-containing protein [Lipomyces tetrasporus]
MTTLNATEKPESAHCEESVLGLGDEKSKAKVGYSGARTEQTAEEKRLVKKLDLWIMPTLWLMYWLNCLDRNAIALARLDHIEEDLGLTGTQYQTCVSILFVGYLIGQVPSNMFITRTKPSYYMSVCMALWAIVSILTAVSRNFTGLSIFYTRKEIATRISILYTGNILATAFAGLIATGVFSGMSGTAGTQDGSGF